MGEYRPPLCSTVARNSLKLPTPPNTAASNQHQEGSSSLQHSTHSRIHSSNTHSCSLPHPSPLRTCLSTLPNTLSLVLQCGHSFCSVCVGHTARPAVDTAAFTAAAAAAYDTLSFKQKHIFPRTPIANILTCTLTHSHTQQLCTRRVMCGEGRRGSGTGVTWLGQTDIHECRMVITA